MANFSNILLAYKILKDLGQKFDEFDAYRLGIIDKEGKLLRSPKTDEEKDAYDSYTRMVINMKRLLQRFVGKNPSVQKLTSLLLLKEGMEQETVDVVMGKLDLPSDTKPISEAEAKIILEQYSGSF